MCVALGLLLLSAATLKFRDMTWEPFGKAFIVPPRLRVIFIEAEALLGLLVGVYRRALRVVATGFFAALAGVSLYLAVNGEPTCGCFGRTTVSPLLMAVIDSFIIVLLFWLRPPSTSFLGVKSSSTKQHVSAVVVWASLVAIVVGGVCVYRSGGVGPTWAAITAQEVDLRPPLSELGAAEAGSTTKFTISIHNRKALPIRIIGGSNNCVGDVTVDLPLTIPAGESRQITIMAYFKAGVGRFVREYTLYTSATDARSGEVVYGRFAGEVLPSP